MDVETLSRELTSIRYILSSPSPTGIAENFDSKLKLLALIINLTAQDELLRNEYSTKEIWKILNGILQDSTSYKPETDFYTEFIRVFRGVLLLIRNLVLHSKDPIHHDVCSSLIHFLEIFPANNPFRNKTVLVYFEILANAPPYQELELEEVNTPSIDLDQNDQDQSRTLILMLNNILKETDFNSVRIPLLHFLFKLLESSKDNETHHNIILYNVFKIDHSQNVILSFILDSFERIDFEDSLNVTNISLIKLLFDIITHESFGKWLLEQQGSDSFLRWLKLCQLVITGKSDWNNYQLIALLSWGNHMFEIYSERCIQMIRASESEKSVEEKRGPHLHLIITILLDVLTDLSKYHQTKEFLIHYKTIEPLVGLLRCVHENIKPITIKDRQKLGTNGKDKNQVNNDDFPHVKSLIIEVISFLTHESFEIQEKVRELHGLEIILSNCVIDENNPFVKERAIVCLKFLLAKNPKNQGFVAELEAKKSYDDGVLQEAGYELAVKDGNISVKQSGK